MDDLICVVLLVVLLAGIFGIKIAQVCNVNTYTVTVEDKESIRSKGGSKYLIFTDKEVFQNTDSWLKGKFNSSDFYRDLKVGKRYHIKTIGFRVPFLSWYKNIIYQKEIK